MNIFHSNLRKCFIHFRLPDNIKTLQNIDLFSVKNILSTDKEDISLILNVFKMQEETIGRIKDQYINIQFIKWKNMTNTTKFLAEVLAYRDAAGNKKFEEISDFVLKLLCLPWSNADVERVFSNINLVKTNIRNRIQLRTINSILAIR